MRSRTASATPSSPSDTSHTDPAGSPGDPAPGPSTTGARARIIEAAVLRYGNDGDAAPLRAIATDAGVSAAAIIKTFGSKTGLREACDAHVLDVLDVLDREKTRSLTAHDDGRTVLTQLAHMDEFQPLVRYIYRSLIEGGEAARALLADLHTQSVAWLRRGVDAGTVAPSADEDARARLLIGISVGWTMQAVTLSGRPVSELDADFWRRTTEDLLPPLLELYTTPLLTDHTMMDAFLRHRENQQ